MSGGDAPTAKLGDINGEDNVDFKDAMPAVQVLFGIETDKATSTGDVNGDTRIGIEEMIYILQEVSGLR